MTGESWEKFFICEIVKNRKKYNLNEKKERDSVMWKGTMKAQCESKICSKGVLRYGWYLKILEGQGA